MSSHVVGGLSHLWDDRTAPNNVAKGTTQEQLGGFSHDHGFYCVNNLADSLSTNLTTNDDPFLGVTHMEYRSEWNEPVIPMSRSPPQDNPMEGTDLGGRLTPEDLLPWYEKFDITTNFLDNYSLEKSRSRNNSTSIPLDLGLPSSIGTQDFSLLNECDWMSPTFNNNFLNDSMLGLDSVWPKLDLTSENADSLCDGSQLSEDSRSTESPLVEDVPEKKESKQSSPEPEVEYSSTGRVKRQCRRKTVMDIMREACEVPDFEEPIMMEGAKEAAALTFGSYFETKDVARCLDKPKVRGVVVKPYVDAATFRRRVMNRESARKYRARKRREKYQVKNNLLDLEKHNVDLKVELLGLEKEIASLKKKMNM